MCLDCALPPISILSGARGHASGRNRPRDLPVTACAPLATGFLNNPGYNGSVEVSDSDAENETLQGPMYTKQYVNRHQMGLAYQPHADHIVAAPRTAGTQGLKNPFVALFPFVLSAAGGPHGRRVPCIEGPQRLRRLVALSLLLALAGPQNLAAAPAGTEVVRASERSVTVSVRFAPPRVEWSSPADSGYDGLSVEGCGWIEAVGKPLLPVRRVRVGIPFGVEPRLRLVSVEEGNSLGSLNITPVPVGRGATDGDGLDFIRHDIHPDEGVYRRDAFYPATVIEEKRVSVLRYQQLLEVDVYPVQWNPVSGGARWISSVTFEVTWLEGKEEKFLAPAPEESRWEGVYSRLIVNHESARPWRRAPRFRFRSKTAERQEEFKIIISETGLYRIDFGDLPGVGTPVSLSRLGVYRKQYVDPGEMPYEEIQVPVHVVDEDGDGSFGGSDWLYFWALGFRDQFMVHDFEDRYADRNVYWIGWGESGGERMDTAEVWTGEPVDTLSHFAEELFYEEDRHNWHTPTTVDIDGIPPRSDVDWWYWTSRTASGGSLPFELYDPVPDSTARLRIRFQGYIKGTHSVAPMLVNAQSQIHALGPQSFAEESEYFYDTGDSLPAGFLTHGTNYFQFGGKSAFGAFLDWITVWYDRSLTARDDYLVFNTGHLGEGTVQVEGFGDTEIRLAEVSDPAQPVWVDLGEGQVLGTAGDYRLVFPESTAVRKTYVAFTPRSARKVEGEFQRTGVENPCWLREGDYLLITHEEFEEECRRLASYRRGQGLQVQVVRVDEVYDAFSGGMKDPLAIKRYLRWAFDHWTVRPQFAVLVGDGSDDHRGLHADSGPDFIPPPHFMWVNEPTPGDNWYVDLDDDYTLDIYLGRLPVGSVPELEDLIDKIIAYEQFDPGDAWRGRFLAVSDDRCSTTASSDYLCNRAGEDRFEGACRYTLSRAAESTGAPLDTIALHMSEYTGYSAYEGWHLACLDGADLNLRCMRAVVRDSLTPALFDILNDGVLMFQFQGHGNRTVMAHEHIVVDGVYIDGRYNHDIAERLSNDGRPFILATFGCHFADFSQVEENSVEWQESLVEKMLLFPDGGAIAGMGPVGYEEYRIARSYQMALADVFFDTPPWVSAGGDTVGTRWLLGELGASMILLGGYDEPAYRIVILGDPALRIDALPPGFAVTVDGTTVEDGDFLTSSGHSERVCIRAVIGDEVAVDTSSVRVLIRKGTSIQTLARGVDYTLAVADSVSGGRLVVAEYRHGVEIAEYDIVFEARDRNGLLRTFTLKVRFSNEVFFDGVRAFDGDYVSPGAEVEMGISLPMAVPAGDLAVLVQGAGGEWAPDIVREALGPDSTQWRLRFALEGLAEGRHTLQLLVGEVRTDALRFVLEGELAVRNLTNYPNPFQDGTDIIFQLTVPADIEIRIFTVAGKKLATFVTKGENGYNRIYWNGRDNDGDEVANGVYLYRVIARGGGKEAQSEIQKAMRIR